MDITWPNTVPYALSGALDCDLMVPLLIGLEIQLPVALRNVFGSRKKNLPMHCVRGEILLLETA